MAHDVLSKAALLARMDNDPGLLGDVIDLFLKHLPQVMDRLRQAVASGDAEQLRQAAHRLRGGLVQFEVHSCVAGAQELERIGASGDLASAAPVTAELEAAMANLVPALEALRGDLV